jgi:hypothetical protein
MSEMIERVAKAIWDDACPGMTWGEIDRLTYRGWAQAAIEAMREPTGEMIDAGAGSVVIVGFGRFSLEGQPSKAWRAMIDAALPASREGGENGL